LLIVRFAHRARRPSEWCGTRTCVLRHRAPRILSILLLLLLLPSASPNAS
jgi:hypothetical protein